MTYILSSVLDASRILISHTMGKHLVWCVLMVLLPTEWTQPSVQVSVHTWSTMHAYLEPGAYHLERATPILSQRHDVLTDALFLGFVSREIGQLQSTWARICEEKMAVFLCNLPVKWASQFLKKKLDLCLWLVTEVPVEVWIRGKFKQKLKYIGLWKRRVRNMEWLHPLSDELLPKSLKISKSSLIEDLIWSNIWTGKKERHRVAF